MKINLQQVDRLYAGIAELLERGLSPQLIYKLVKNKKALQPHVEVIQETIQKVSSDNEGVDQSKLVQLQNNAINLLFKEEVEVDLKEVDWSDLPQEVLGTTVDKIEVIMKEEM